MTQMPTRPSMDGPVSVFITGANGIIGKPRKLPGYERVVTLDGMRQVEAWAQSESLI